MRQRATSALAGLRRRRPHASTESVVPVSFNLLPDAELSPAHGRVGQQRLLLVEYWRKTQRQNADPDHGAIDESADESREPIPVGPSTLNVNGRPVADAVAEPTPTASDQDAGDAGNVESAPVEPAPVEPTPVEPAASTAETKETWVPASVLFAQPTPADDEAPASSETEEQSTQPAAETDVLLTVGPPEAPASIEPLPDADDALADAASSIWSSVPAPAIDADPVPATEDLAVQDDPSPAEHADVEPPPAAVATDTPVINDDAESTPADDVVRPVDTPAAQDESLEVSASEAVDEAEEEDEEECLIEPPEEPPLPEPVEMPAVIAEAAEAEIAEPVVAADVEEVPEASEPSPSIEMPALVAEDADSSEVTPGSLSVEDVPSSDADADGPIEMPDVIAEAADRDDPGWDPDLFVAEVPDPGSAQPLVETPVASNEPEIPVDATPTQTAIEDTAPAVADEVPTSHAVADAADEAPAEIPTGEDDAVEMPAALVEGGTAPAALKPTEADAPTPEAVDVPDNVEMPAILAEAAEAPEPPLTSDIDEPMAEQAEPIEPIAGVEMPAVLAEAADAPTPVDSPAADDDVPTTEAPEDAVSDVEMPAVLAEAADAPELPLASDVDEPMAEQAEAVSDVEMPAALAEPGELPGLAGDLAEPEAADDDLPGVAAEIPIVADADRPDLEAAFAAVEPTVDEDDSEDDLAPAAYQPPPNTAGDAYVAPETDEPQAVDDDVALEPVTIELPPAAETFEAPVVAAQTDQTVDEPVTDPDLAALVPESTVSEEIFEAPLTAEADAVDADDVEPAEPADVTHAPHLAASDDMVAALTAQGDAEAEADEPAPTDSRDWVSAAARLMESPEELPAPIVEPTEEAHPADTAPDAVEDEAAVIPPVDADPNWREAVVRWTPSARARRRRRPAVLPIRRARPKVPAHLPALETFLRQAQARRRHLRTESVA